MRHAGIGGEEGSELIDGIEGDNEITTLRQEMQAIKKELADLRYQVEISIPANFVGSPKKELLWLMLAIIFLQWVL
jgi:hypothetical protein